MLPSRLDFRRLFHAAAAALAFATTFAGNGNAQGKLDARYTATLAGITVGRGSWVLDIGDDQYTATASGATTGLLRVFAGGRGTSAARGTIVGGQPVPGTYASTISSDKKSDEVRMVIYAGAVKEYVVDPPAPPNPDRIPVTEAHRRGVIDPMTASLVRVAGDGNPISAEACQRKAAVFDGRLRYDLQLAFKRMDNVKAEKGYQGPVVVCSLSFTPLAGYVPDRPAVNFLINSRDIEVWFAPIAGTRIVVPFRISLPTPIGLGVLEATQFISTVVTRPIPTSAKTQ